MDLIAAILLAVVLLALSAGLRKWELGDKPKKWLYCYTCEDIVADVKVSGNKLLCPVCGCDWVRIVVQED